MAHVAARAVEDLITLVYGAGGAATRTSWPGRCSVSGRWHRTLTHQPPPNERQDRHHPARTPWEWVGPLLISPRDGGGGVTQRWNMETSGLVRARLRQKEQLRDGVKAGGAVQGSPLDYQRLGLSPRSIGPVGGCGAPRDSRLTYEGWYFHAHLADGAKLVVTFM